LHVIELYSQSVLLLDRTLDRELSCNSTRIRLSLNHISRDGLGHPRGGQTLKSKCEKCKLRAYAERKPNSLLARIWRWHTGWCPGWKAYQRELAEEGKTKTS
jgi:hypothetical protein